MLRQELIQQLKGKHSAFTAYIAGLPNTVFETAVNGKWSPGQQLDHIHRSTRPVVLAFTLPKFVLGMAFGKPNRPIRNYNELVQKYLSKLQLGGRATGRFIPQPLIPQQKEKTIKALESTIVSLCNKISRSTEEDLDKFLLPHPLLGKLTLREMIYFTIYHVEHHHVQTQQNR
jgi:DinB superfamily